MVKIKGSLVILALLSSSYILTMNTEDQSLMLSGSPSDNQIQGAEIAADRFQSDTYDTHFIFPNSPKKRWVLNQSNPTPATTAAASSPLQGHLSEPIQSEILARRKRIQQNLGPELLKQFEEEEQIAHFIDQLKNSDSEYNTSNSPSLSSSPSETNQEIATPIIILNGSPSGSPDEQHCLPIPLRRSNPIDIPGNSPRELGTPSSILNLPRTPRPRIPSHETILPKPSKQISSADGSMPTSLSPSPTADSHRLNNSPDNTHQEISIIVKTTSDSDSDLTDLPEIPQVPIGSEDPAEQLRSSEPSTLPQLNQDVSPAKTIETGNKILISQKTDVIPVQNTTNTAESTPVKNLSHEEHNNEQSLHASQSTGTPDTKISNKKQGSTRSLRPLNWKHGGTALLTISGLITLLYYLDRLPVNITAKIDAIFAHFLTILHPKIDTV